MLVTESNAGIIGLLDREAVLVPVGEDDVDLLAGEDALHLRHVELETVSVGTVGDEDLRGAFLKLDTAEGHAVHDSRRVHVLDRKFSLADIGVSGGLHAAVVATGCEGKGEYEQDPVAKHGRIEPPCCRKVKALADTASLALVQDTVRFQDRTSDIA